MIVEQLLSLLIMMLIVGLILVLDKVRLKSVFDNNYQQMNEIWLNSAIEEIYQPQEKSLWQELKPQIQLDDGAAEDSP